ncbi:Dabb family protein [Paenibacillus sp. y28]|uniref:Dabb family protein n=1 Tax=Paenibacillus sp. y28 TaxID=3129110 RepID=UPI00301961FE
MGEHVTHTVFFDLLVQPESEEAERFLASSRLILMSIPGVAQFQVLRQISPRNDLPFGFIMKFLNHAAYAAFQSHPEYRHYLREVWQRQVAMFQEIAYVPWKEASLLEPVEM